MDNIISSFKSIVNSMPNESAIRFEGNSYSYKELDLQSDHIASFLAIRQMRGKQVGVAMKRGQEWIAVLLGIWKAGAVYVPLDLNHPQERLKCIIADCGIALVICSKDENRNNGFRSDNILTCCVCEMLQTEIKSQELTLPASGDRAYIMYTSGTSGEPKGIPTNHQQAVRMSKLAKDKNFYVNSGDRMLQLAGLNFSASLVETLTALLNGVCLVIANEKERHDPGLLIKLIECERVCSALIPPALLAVFPKQPLDGLNTLMVAGEGVATDVKDFWMKGRRMVNAYGFTENTVLVASGIYTEETPVNDIGTLVPESIAYVLDEEFNPVLNGTPGELCIAGPQLTEGYWNRRELNKKKFIPNPFLTGSGEHMKKYSRLYRSGDKVVRLNNGHFLYLGRLDNQVKIRGMRVELSEVEQSLNRYPGVSLSVVLAKEYMGRKVLVAYLQADEEILQEKIATFVAEKLPDYMRPAFYVTLPNFPMTINRKIDKSQLPEPDWNSKEGKEQPATGTEKEIAHVWHKLLGVTKIGRTDNFISLGGDSISVLLMTNALEQVFSIRLKVEDVFARLDLHVLAHFIEHIVVEQLKNDERIIHRNVYASCPLHPALRNLWSQCVTSPEMNEAYKLVLCLPWGKDLQVKLLQKAWNRIVQEQEAMRMSFPLDNDGKPRIHVEPFVYKDIPVYEVTESEFWEKFKVLYLQSFQLEEGPLHRVCLYRLPKGEFRFVIIIHHLVTDGWSAKILDSKLHTYYHCVAQEDHFSIEDYSYRDYVMWHKEQLSNIIIEERKSFWKYYLSGCLPLSFEGMGENKALSKKQGGAKYIPMDGRLVESLETYCSRHGVTPLVACLSVFQLILIKYTGQTEFAVGLAVTDRKRVEFHNLLGYFVSLLPVCTIQNRDNGFDFYTTELMKVMANLLGNSLPLDLILDSMEGSIDIKQRANMIRFAFGLEESPSDIYVPEEWITSSPFDLVLIINKYKGNYSFHFQYATVCFDEKFVIQFCESFQVALRFLLNEPSRNMLECPLLAENRIIERTSSFALSGVKRPLWNVVGRFEEIATVQSECEAYCWADFRMNYDALNTKSDRLAAAIHEKLVGMEIEQGAVPVGIFLNDKKYFLPAIIGVLKNGGCYVPLDTTLPIERLLFILEDAAVSLLIVDESYNLHLPCETLVINNLMETELPVVFQSAIPEPEDTAYIIYTSGSTGKPKGVPISHRSLAFLINNQAAFHHIQPGKRILQYASVGFDASIIEIFQALITGATLVIPTEKERKDSNLLLNLLEKEKVYFAIIPPALLSILPERVLPDLEIIIAAGESTPFDVMDRWRKGRRFINAYGPTENTVATTSLEISDGFLSNDIGTPLPGVSCYVMDNHMTLLPDYVPGELYIGGLQLTTGYINRIEFNREKFVSNPFVSSEDKKTGVNIKLYKSGDKVMRTSEGHYLFLGRMDSQVKLHGFRIELEEIAKQLEEYPGVLQAVVLLKEFGNEKRIVAYLLTGETQETEYVKSEKVRKFLSERLPAYMIPSAWAVLKSFPLSVNGKVDRKILPEPELLIADDYEPPVSKEEEILAKIAACLLQLPQMGVCTDLISVGLTSLQIMELVHDAQENNLSLSVTGVYRERTIRKILLNREKSLSFWKNESDSSKPLVVLVCGYPYFEPFYNRFVDRFKSHYSFFIFESFLEYFRHKDQVDANELVNCYSKILETELEGREIYEVAGHCLGSELAMMLAERLRTNGHPSIRALIIEGFIRRDKSLLIPEPVDNKALLEQSRITNEMIKSLPELSFGGEMIVFLADKVTNRFMFETDESAYDSELIRKMWEATRKNWIDWKDLYPQAICHKLNVGHWDIFDDEPLAAISEIVKRTWK